MSRAFSRLLISLLTSLVTLHANISATADSFINFEGNGFGHGVGMSQIGAKAMALEGKTADEILKYYYTGVNVEPLADWFDVRVNIGTKLTFASIKLASDVGSILINGNLISDKQSLVTFRYTSSGITTTITKNRTTIASIPAQSEVIIEWTGTRFLEGPTAVVSFNNGKWSRYQYGRINLVVVGKSFEVTNTVRLKDEYLYGLSEVPSSWPTEVLKAQVIAARTYAISKAGIYRRSCDCDLIGSTKDQMFVGLSKITEPRFGQFWKAAVDATNVDERSGYAITYKGEPINAYYSSSSGGQTESALDAFGTAFDYLQPVADPVSLDPIANPRFASWQRSINSLIVAKAFGLLDVSKLEIIGKRIYATSLNGTRLSLRLETFRSRTGLPSSTFKVLP
jgi:SpoIID/LytB domain protein